MAQQDVIRSLCLLLFASNLVNYSLCTRYDYVYEEYGLEYETICHPLEKRNTIEITNTAAIVKPKHGSFDRWNVNLNLHCKFVFKASKGDGLFGVIQKMSFRRNGTQCIDYVQFKRKDNHWTEKFCGTIDRSKVKYYPVPESEGNNDRFGMHLPATTYSEYDQIEHKSKGELETEIFISKERLREGEFLALTIVYTSFKNCSNVDLEKYKSIGYKACIRNEFFCDGIYNCAPEVCSDESDCPNSGNDIISSGTGTKVTVGAVTTMILCFIIFVMCLWICKRSQKLCWSLDCAGPNTCSSRAGPLPRETEGSINPPVPTAPMLEVAVSPSVADKDLPPSYDSLFPEQSNPARS